MLMPKKSEIHRCGRCEIVFTTINALRKHSKKHTATLAEIKLLQQGHMPVETKMGSEFRGKNKIIVA